MNTRRSNFEMFRADRLEARLDDVPRGNSEWKHDNPVEAVKEFTKKHSEFKVEQPAWQFNESGLTENITHWPMAYLKLVGNNINR